MLTVKLQILINVTELILHYLFVKNVDLQIKDVILTAPKLVVIVMPHQVGNVIGLIDPNLYAKIVNQEVQDV